MLAARGEQSHGPWGANALGRLPTRPGSGTGPGRTWPRGAAPGGRWAPKGLQNRGSEGKLEGPAGRVGRGAEGNRDHGHDSLSAAASWGSALGCKQTPSVSLKTAVAESAQARCSRTVLALKQVSRGDWLIALAPSSGA